MSVRSYKILDQQVFTNEEYSLVPIRHEDRYAIMKWRNEQMYHLRQSEPLTREKQDWYFENVVSKLFDEEQPNQILFSFLKEDECIGYGGLVHINWVDKNAEISLVLDTDLEKSSFQTFWYIFLSMLKKVAFRQLALRKIYTFAFDIRPKLYPALEQAGFVKDAALKDHCFVNNEFYDVIIHSFWNPRLKFHTREATGNDLELFFKWANDPDVRANSFNTEPIKWEEHIKWFLNKIESGQTNIYVFEAAGRPFGQVRFDLNNNYWEIDFSIDKNYRGLGLGREIIRKSLEYETDKNIKAFVQQNNYASRKVFKDLGFKEKNVCSNYSKPSCYEYTYSN